MPVLLCGRNGWILPLLLATLLACIAPASAATGLKPDVVPTSLSLGSDTLARGGTTPLQLAVTNQGRSTAYSVTVTISIVTAGAASQVARISLGTLKPGTSGTIVTTLTAPLQGGSHSVVATATTRRDGVPANNSLTTTLQVTDSSTPPGTFTATRTSTTQFSTTASSTAVSSSSTAVSSTARSSTMLPETASTSSTTTPSSGPTTSSSDTTTSSSGATTSSSDATTSPFDATISSSSGTTTSALAAADSTPCDYYASPNGGGDGLSSSRPFRIQDFWEKAAAGKTLCLLDGTYQGAANMITPPAGKSGTSTAPITVRALNDGRVVIDGQFARHVFLLTGNSYWIFQGFDIGNSVATVLEVYHGSNHNIFRRLVAYHANPSARNEHVLLNWDSSNNLFEDLAGFGYGRNTLSEYGTGTHDNVWRRIFVQWQGFSNNGGPGIQADYNTTGPTLYENLVSIYNPQHQGAAGFTHDLCCGFVYYGALTSGVWHTGTTTYRGVVAWGYDGPAGGGTPYYQDPKTKLNHSWWANLGMPNSVKDIFVDGRSHPNVPVFVFNCNVGGCTGNSVDRATGIRGTAVTCESVTGTCSDLYSVDWARTNMNSCTSLGDCPNIYTGDNPGTGSRACFRYDNGTLTSTPLWPWPMDDRIKTAFARTGTRPLAGGAGAGYAANTVTSELVSRYGAIPAQCRR